MQLTVERSHFRTSGKKWHLNSNNLATVSNSDLLSTSIANVAIQSESSSCKVPLDHLWGLLKAISQSAFRIGDVIAGEGAVEEVVGLDHRLCNAI